MSCANNRVVSIIKAELGNRKFPHYYGDISRIFFLLAGIIMLLGLPILNQTISVPAYISILFVLSVVFIAGITNPAQRMLSVLDLIVSLVGFIVFEYYSVKVFAEGSIYFIYLINQAIAILFLLAFYFAVKTVRGFIVPEKKPPLP